MSTVEVQKMLENCRQATLLEVQPKIEMLTQQLNILMKNMSSANQCPQGVSVGTPQSVSASCDILPTRNNYHSVDVYPITTIKENIKIRSPRQIKQVKDQSVNLSAAATARRAPLVGENVFMVLGKYCKRLVNMLASFPGNGEGKSTRKFKELFGLTLTLIAVGFSITSNI
nr:uncharacterized protein LOC109164617 [Ipomoea batatas]